MTSLISIALCTYNGAVFIEQQIISIVNQSYKEIEIIVVDDCSKDNTNEIVEKLASIYPQIKHFKNETNLGFNKNFEKAINLSKGDFIAISDQDDIWELDKLELLLNNIGNNWLIFSNSKYIDEKGNFISGQILADAFSLSNRDYRSILFSNFVTGHTVLFSKDFANYFLPFHKTGYYDWWMGFVAMYHGKITYLNKCLTQHRMHTTSVTSNAYKKDKEQTKKALIDEMAAQLNISKTYKNLKTEDKKIIEKISSYFNQKFSPQLIWLILAHYPIYFKDIKQRKWLSRLNFALRFK